VYKKSVIPFIFILTLFAFISPASADYIGPDRQVTTASEVCKVVLWECMYVPAKDEYRYRKADEWACASEGKEWQGYDNVGPECGAWSNGRTYWSREYTFTTVTITHPEATITGVLQNCTLQNGWCVTPPQLALTANEPLSGHGILLIEGTRNAEVFACEELQTNCAIPLLEGENNFEYWALSSWGDSSRKGTMSIKVDTVAPNLNLLVNGTLGLNNWYVSNPTITAEGADDTSGIYEKVLSIDNGNTWIPETTLTDGVYQVDIKITDNAYNVSTASTTLQVDTTTPTLSLTISGIKGNNNFYTSNAKITANTSDATSGIATVQAKINNGNWIDTNEINLSDGIHTYQFRVYDNAGNMTETPIQQIAVDTTPPTVEADTKINLGETLYYTLRDDGSGLLIERIVIEDEDEKYKKIVWLTEISGNKTEGDILWDGKFADKTLAGVGEYYITFKISDRAGNETFYTTVVNVNPISYLQVIPEFIPPVSDEIPSNQLPSNESEQSFGGTNNTPTQPSEAQTLISLTGTAIAIAGVNTNTTSTSNILWGTAAAAVIGMATAYALEQQKKREEEEAAQIAQVQAEVDAKNAAIEAQQLAMREQLKIQNWLQGQELLEAWIEQLESQKADPTEIERLKAQAGTDGISVAISKAENLSLSLAVQQFINQQAYDMYRQGEYESVPIQDEEENPFVGLSVGSGVGTSGGTKVSAMPVSSDNPPNLLERIWPWSDWNNTRRDLIHNLEEHQKILIEASGNKAEDYYYYDAKTLGLNWWQFPTMSTSQFQKLNTYIDSGEVSWNDTLNQVNTLQTYFGYSNKTMITALRELYYETTLDYFIANAEPVKPSIYSVSGTQNGITSSEASFSRAMLILTTQGHGYTPAVIQIQHPQGYNSSGEFAFDHIIAAIDGNFNQIKPENIDLGFFGEIYAKLIGLDKTKMETVSAVTYIGDLAGSTAVAFQYSDAPKGYEIEMSQSDLEGDILGVVLANNNAINPNGNNLAQELSKALSPNSQYVVQKYSYFADAIGLDVNNGTISPFSTQTFIEQNKELIADLGAGFYASQPPKINIPARVWNGGKAYFAQPTLEIYAETQITNFLEQLNQGLQGEFDK
jgi:hypothetical protein